MGEKYNMAFCSDIHTRRLLITPFQEKHLTAFYLGWLNNRELMKYSEQRHRAHSLESCRSYMQAFSDSPHYFWALEYEFEHVGNMNAYVDEYNLLADLGILIGAPHAQGKGIGCEAWLAVCKFLFEQRNIRKITAGALSVNLPMLHLMEKAGMREDGMRKKHYLCNDQEVDIVFMALFFNDWRAVQRNQASTDFV